MDEWAFRLRVQKEIACYLKRQFIREYKGPRRTPAALTGRQHQRDPSTDRRYSGRENGEHLKLPRDSRVASIQQSTGMAPVLFFLPQPFQCRTCYQHQQLDQRHIFPCGLFPLITRNLQWVLLATYSNQT